VWESREPRLVDNVLDECATDTASPLPRSDKNPGKPRCVLWPGIHLMMHEHSGTEELRARRSNKGDGQLAPTGALLKKANAVGDGIAWTEICPLAKVPLRESGNELRPICEKLDLHTAYVVR
jgi:hypothetical protein